jgi:hypothetical protein
MRREQGSECSKFGRLSNMIAMTALVTAAIKRETTLRSSPIWVPMSEPETEA